MADDGRTSASDGSVEYDPVLTVTEAARAVVLEARSQETDAEHLALWVEVSGAQGNAFTYDIYFQSPADAGRSDAVQHSDDLTVVVPRDSIPKLRRARLDLSEDNGGGLVIVNPNAPPPPPSEIPDSVFESDLSGDLAQRVLAVLEEQVNPSIAAHGGRADLVAVQEDVAYLRLSGGCQGCGMAKVTLSQGIEVAITQFVPEITSVVDVTNHAQGSNPYYEPAKK